MLRISAVLICVCLAAGCASSTPAPVLYSAANPGPWKDVQVVTKFTADQVAVEVKNFPKSPTNYVLKFTLIDQRGENVGDRIFGIDDDSAESFFLDPASRYFILTVTSTGQGAWVSAKITIPPPPVKQSPITPPK